MPAGSRSVALRDVRRGPSSTSRLVVEVDVHVAVEPAVLGEELGPARVMLGTIEQLTTSIVGLDLFSQPTDERRTGGI